MASTFTNLLYHVIFSTKNRIPCIDTALRQDLHAYLGGIVRELGGAALEIGGVADHVHLLVKLPPKIALSDFMRTLKANSSKWMNEEKLKLRKFGWQDGYSAFSVSKSQTPEVRSYIQNQEAHHQRKSYQDELRALLRRHEIEFDERYIWG
ncbi:MAG TPA: IS200/IS605 family transposase [Pirellulales bacterium]